MNSIVCHPFYQIAQGVELLFTPAAAAPAGGILGAFVAWLDHWQTLVGALTGGLLGVAGALIVATKTVGRQRWIAASSLLPETQQLMAAHNALEQALNDPDCPVEDWQRPRWYASQLLQRPPQIRALHKTAAVTQLSDVDVRLNAHLSRCQIRHEGLESLLEDYRVALNASRAPMPPANVAASEEGLERRAKHIKHAWDLCAEHAALATYFMDRLIFNRWPNIIHRLRMRGKPNDLDRRSAYLLKTGSVLKPEDVA